MKTNVKKPIRVNAMLNMIKQTMQIIFPVITIPYITRVLLPDSYGKINTGNSLISYISLIAGLGIASYAVREGSLVRDDQEKLNDFSNQVFTINLLSTFAAYLVLAVIVFLVPHYSEYRLLLAIQGTVVLFTTLGADWINSIEEDYLYLTIRYIVLHIISLGLMFWLVKKPEDYYIYALISLVTSVGANVMNMFYIRKYVKLRITFHIELKNHLTPILILFANAVAMTIYVSSDITMIEIFKGEAEVGIYTVATKIYSIVKQVLNALLVVSIPRLTAYIGAGDYERFVTLGKKMLSALITLLCPIVVGIIIFRKEAILLAGGEKYISGAYSLLILSLAVGVALLATFYAGSVLMPLRKEKYILRGTVISAIINVCLNLFFIPLWGGTGAAVTTLISEIFVAVYFGFVVWKEGYRFIDFKVLFLAILGSMAVIAVCAVVFFLCRHIWIRLIISVALSGITYGLVQIIGKNRTVMELIPRKRK